MPNEAVKTEEQSLLGYEKLTLPSVELEYCK